MRKYTQRLFDKKFIEGKKSFKVGNHKINTIGNSIYLSYHGNNIILIDFLDKKIIIDNCGYNTTSTIQAINSHLEGINDYLFNKDKFEFIVVGYEGKDNLKHDKLIKSLFGKNAIHL